MLVNDECSSWQNRVGDFQNQFRIGVNNFCISMDQCAWPNRTTPLQYAWSMALCANTIECEQFIYLQSTLPHSLHRHSTEGFQQETTDTRQKKGSERYRKRKRVKRRQRELERGRGTEPGSAREKEARGRHRVHSTDAPCSSRVIVWSYKFQGWS